jgi:ribosome-associated toxin RatA of RatAB toxin-antitoxin module
MVVLDKTRSMLACCPTTLRRSLRRCAVVLGCAIAASAAAADPPVTSKETIVAGHALPRIDATTLIDAPVERLWPLVSECNRFREYMDLESAREIGRRGTWSRCELVVDVPFPFGKLRSVSDQLDERAAGRYRVSWKLVSGDYLYDEGFWELTSLGPTRTRVRYVTLTEPRLPVPRGMLLDGQRDFVKDLLARLRKRALTVR